MFISKRIYDPTQTSFFRKQNAMGRTIGLVLYTPKYWNCKKYDFYANQFDEMRNGELTEDEMEHRYQSKRAHRNCKRKHLSSRGYLYWLGPKRRYQFHYMGDINPHNSNPPWGYIRKHGMYIRLFDNGPQSKPREPLTEEDRMILDYSWKHFTECMDKARNTMLEYERIRERR